MFSVTKRRKKFLSKGYCWDVVYSYDTNNIQRVYEEYTVLKDDERVNTIRFGIDENIFLELTKEYLAISQGDFRGKRIITELENDLCNILEALFYDKNFCGISIKNILFKEGGQQW